MATHSSISWTGGFHEQGRFHGQGEFHGQGGFHGQGRFHGQGGIHGQGSPVGYGPWDRKESDTTEYTAPLSGSKTFLSP